MRVQAGWSSSATRFGLSVYERKEKGESGERISIWDERKGAKCLFLEKSRMREGFRGPMRSSTPYIYHPHVLASDISSISEQQHYYYY